MLFYYCFVEFITVHHLRSFVKYRIMIRSYPIMQACFAASNDQILKYVVKVNRKEEISFIILNRE